MSLFYLREYSAITVSNASVTLSSSLLSEAFQLVTFIAFHKVDMKETL